MNRILLSNLKISGVDIERLHVFTDDDSKLILFPLLWCLHLSITGLTYHWKNVGTPWSPRFNSRLAKAKDFGSELVASNIERNTIENYTGHLFHFLQYVNKTSNLNSKINLKKLELIDHDFLNNYVNHVLPEHLSSISALNSHVSSITSFFSFLSYLGLREYTPITIYRKTKEFLGHKDTSRKKISYISKSQRSALLFGCNTFRDKLIFRMGFEVGLRTSENRGLVMSDFKARGSMHPGLNNLFCELETYPNKDRFKYLLNGKFTKGGKSRYIFFERNLLIDMQRYCNTERKSVLQKSNTTSDNFFIRYDPQFVGQPINANIGTRIFNKEKKKSLESTYFTYHDLRHTFATELYYSELIDLNGKETRSENTARIVVAERLGHKDIKTTLIYIQLVEHLRLIENHSNE